MQSRITRFFCCLSLLVFSATLLPTADAKPRARASSARAAKAGKTTKIRAARGVRANKKVIAKGRQGRIVVAKAGKSRRQAMVQAKSMRGRRGRAASIIAVRQRGRRGRRVLLSRGRLPLHNAARSYVAGGPWLEPSFAESTTGDHIDGEDLTVRRAAVEALGPLNGTVVVVDPNTGRILAMVNQKLALKSGFQPCSTIKVVATLAGLSEGIVDRDTRLPMGGHLTLTEALARSQNGYFANIGIKLGYDKIAYHARLLGLGEKAGLNIVGEQQGGLPDGPPRNGGMGMMTSFGEGITLTPLQLAGVMATIANGGTLYYLQQPRSATEIQTFVPRVKRHLEIAQHLPELKPGMLGATEFGSARRAYYNPQEPIMGKTGTCTDRRTPTHLGWFGSFNEVGRNKLVVVVLLTGGGAVSGPVASGVAGRVYRQLSEQNYFAQDRLTSPLSLVSQ